jgi:ketosteroid isomerase-like protein
MRHRLIVLLMSGLLASSAFAGPKEDALSVLDQWTKAFAASDVDAIVKLYAPETYFMGTGSKSVVTDHAAIRKYFEDAILTRRPRAAPITESHVVVLSDDAVLITGLNSSNGVLDGKPFSNPGRVTFVIAKRGLDWKIVHFHRSAMPK